MTEALPLGTSTTQYGERGRETDEQGLNTKAGFDVKVADEISNITGHKFITAPTFTGDATKVLALAGSTTGTGEIAATLSNGSGTGVVAVSKSGTGTWTLSSANSYTGSTTVSGGILSISNALALGANTGATTVTAGSLSLTGGITVSGEALTINGIGLNSSGALRNGGGNNTWTGDVFLGASGGTGTNNAARIGAVSGTITVSGTIQDGATRNVGVRNADGAGTTVFSGQNTYTGATHIVVGPLRVGSLNSVETNPVLGTVKSGSSNLGAPTSVEDGTIHFSSGTAVVGQLIYTGTGETTDRVLNLFGTTTGAVLSQSGTGLLKFTSALTATGLGNKTLALQGSTSGTGEIAGAIVNSTGFATSVSKSGTGTWTLSGANTYSGSTTVTGGVMVVSGGINSTTSLSVTGGTFRLGASDVVADAATVTLGTGGILQTNNFSDILGVLAVSGNATVNLTGTSVLQFANSSVPSWSGMLTISGWSGLAAGDGAERLVFGSDASGLTPDQLSRITFNNPEGFAAGNYGAAILASGEVVPLIPEPSAVLLALTSTCGLFLRRRRGAGRA
ncbi:MAG: hypothetical protein EOP87_09710 [Verrucomicrobiaceae bacterium]|nr:MAG: hypothetical protein EOP87_09710 [Verrucomicrobiaceae bacterium]